MTPVKASCHCGAVQIQVPTLPEEINDCQCTLCRRYGAAWAYYGLDDVSIKRTTPTRKYVWGDKKIEFHFCAVCGCMTHWSPIEGQERDGMGVNSRMMDPEVIRMVNRKTDWEQLSVPLVATEEAHAEDKAKY